MRRRPLVLLVPLLLLGACPSPAGQAADPTPPPTPPAHAVDPPPSGGAHAGSACEVDGDCQSGACEGQGCGPGQGICAPPDRSCTRDLRPYCACDGQTFRASGNCPGRRYAHRGECGVALADGSPCSVAEQCDSGICEGDGCGEGMGVCMPRERRCTRDLTSYCGCDGATFQASGTCPGRRFAHRGECRGGRADGEACTAGSDCASRICEGEGCGDEAGVCRSPDRPCTMDLRPYCGCDGHTFRASGTCPGQRYRHRGECRSGS